MLEKELSNVGLLVVLREQPEEEAADKQKHLFDQMMMIFNLVFALKAMMMIIIIMDYEKSPSRMMRMKMMKMKMLMMMITLVREERKHLHCLFVRTIQCNPATGKTTPSLSDGDGDEDSDGDDDDEDGDDGEDDGLPANSHPPYSHQVRMLHSKTHTEEMQPVSCECLLQCS